MNTHFADVQLALGMPGWPELVIIFMIVLVVFGSKKIPEIGEGLGKGIKNFKKAFEKDTQVAESSSVETKAIPKNQKPAADEQYTDAKDHQAS
ncbi:MAG: twin-arginine translocase TatA/TatE family subunit [Bradymonadia bacterium]